MATASDLDRRVLHHCPLKANFSEWKHVASFYHGLFPCGINNLTPQVSLHPAVFTGLDLSQLAQWLLAIRDIWRSVLVFTGDCPHTWPYSATTQGNTVPPAHIHKRLTIVFWLRYLSSRLSYTHTTLTFFQSLFL